MTSTTSHLPTYLRAALTSDPARPRMTYYDDATGERVELSAVTLAGWVTKTVNLLADSLDVEAGTRVSLHLPLHWLTAVWVIALDACSAEMIINPSGALERPVGVSVIGPHTPVADIHDREQPDELLAVSLAPMAAPFGGIGGSSLPEGARDFCAEVRTMPDQIVLPLDGSGPLNGEGAARVDRLRLRPHARLAAFDASDTPEAASPWSLDRDRLIDTLVAPLTVDGSVVWVRNPSPELWEQRRVAEQVTSVLPPLPEGITGPDTVSAVE